MAFLKEKIDISGKFKSLLPSRLVWVLFIGLVLVTAFVRLYRLEDLTIFLDDQGRDVLVAAKALKEGDIPFIGPMASIGNLYLGPLFYWLITPALALANFNPVGPIVLIAALSVVTNILLFFFMKRYFSLRSAFVSAWLFALSPLVVENSRFIWNPNPVPLFSLIFFWAYLNFWEKKQPRSLLIAGMALGVLIQLHYVTGILLLVAFLGLLVWQLVNRAEKGAGKNWLALVLGVILPLIPFILFEIKNKFINTRAGWQFIFAGDGSKRLMSPWQAFYQTLTSFSQEALGVDWGWQYFLVCLVIFSGLIFFKIGREKKLRGLVILLLTVFWSTVLASVAVIKGQIHLHYLGLLIPLFFIIVGGADYFWQKFRLLRLFSLSWLNLIPLALISFFLLRANYQFLLQDNNRQIIRAQEVAAYIAQTADDNNIFVTSISGSPYAYPYRYYLYLADFTVDSLTPSSVFAICEGEECSDPEGHSLWEIAQFGVLKTVSADHVSHGAWVYELKKQ